MFLLFGLLIPFLGITWTIWITLLVAAIVFTYRHIRKQQRYWQSKGIKHIKPRFLLGAMSIIRSKSFAETVLDIYNEFPEERYHGVYQFLLPTLVIKDPDLIKQITVKEFDKLVNRRQAVKADADPFWSKNLFASRDERWRDLRSTLSPSFTSSKMRIMYTLIEECAQQFVQYFQNKSEDVVELEMKDTFSRYANDVIATTAFGVKCNSLKDKENEFYRMGKDATNFGGWRMLKFFIFGISSRLAQVRYCPHSKKISWWTLSVAEGEGHSSEGVRLLFENNRRNHRDQDRERDRASRHDSLVDGGAKRAPTPRRGNQSQ
jgi:cytochrome P450 family 9